MSRETDDFEPIFDWSPEARRRLIDERGAEIRFLLDDAFTDYADTDELHPYGFGGPDPVDEAVAWAMDRFATVHDLDPTKLPPKLRGFGLFTCARWWLAQKVGKRAFHARQARRIGETRGDDVVQEPESRALLLDTFASRLALTLKDLRDHSCDDLVGFWLGATESWRRHWFGWREDAAKSPAVAEVSSKTRSLRAHDATFRFAVLFRDGLRDQSLPHEVVTATMLSPCSNEPPYRVPDREVAKALAPRVSGTREASRLRKAGAASLVVALCTVLACRPEEPRARLEWLVLRRSISATTLHALDIDGTPGVGEAIDALPPEKGYDDAR